LGLLNTPFSLKTRDPNERPLVFDVGANHGVYTLFAAKLGADVVTLEPQSHLCRLINRVARLNGLSERITGPGPPGAV
jgi:tRNA1(Val) A37 N6-methylase TrmN6